MALMLTLRLPYFAKMDRVWADSFPVLGKYRFVIGCLLIRYEQQGFTFNYIIVIERRQVDWR